MIITISGDINADDQSVVAIDQSVNTADLSAVSPDTSVGTSKQSFENEDQLVDTEESIDIPADEIPPFTAEERAKFARRHEEGYDLNDPRYEALAIEYPNELSIDERLSTHDHQLLSNNVEPNHHTSVSSARGCLDTPTFTIEQELKYAARFEEGYNLLDADYEAWLKINHPESTRPNNTNQTMNVPLPFVDTSSPLSHSPSMASSSAPATIHRSTQLSSVDSTVSLLTHQSPTVTSNSRQGSTQQSPIAELFNIPVNGKSKKKVTTGKARVLTSAECLKVLQDKENEKKQKAEEKEQRKEQRLLKKQQREQELKRKAEERACKAALKEAKLLEKQSKPTRKRQSKHTSSLPNAAAGTGSSGVAAQSPTSDVGADMTPDHLLRSRAPSKRKSAASHTQPNAKRFNAGADEEIDVNRCCVCFELYADDAGTGREWLQCQCSRWIHEDCIDDDDVDIEHSIFCPLC